ncbi:hypothetical protein KRB99_000020 [Salmonella enterica]|nr:hypothetical protein [Salmonella enterica]
MLPNEAIHTDTEFKTYCNQYGKPFEIMCEYIKQQYMKRGFSPSAKSSDRDQLVHKYNNLTEAINIVNNAVKETAPILNI